MTIITRSLLPALAGAAVIVGGLDLTAYAGDSHATANTTTKSASERRPPDARRVGQAFKYVIPKDTTVPFAFRLKALPAGNYLASYDIAINTSVEEPPLCTIGDSRTPFAVRGFGTVSDGVSHSVASGLVHVERTGDARVSCDEGDTMINFLGSQNYVVLTPVTKVSPGDLAEVGPARTPVAFR